MAYVRATYWLLTGIISQLVSCAYFVTPKGEWLEPVHLDNQKNSLQDVAVSLDCGTIEGGLFEERVVFRAYDIEKIADSQGRRAVSPTDDPGLFNSDFGGQTTLSSTDFGTFEPSCFGMARLIQSLGAVILIDRSHERSGSQGETGMPPQPVGVSPKANKLSQPLKPHFKVRYLALETERDYCSWTFIPYFLSFALFPCVEDISAHSEITLLGAGGRYEKKLKLEADIVGVYGIAAWYFMLVDFFRSDEKQRSSRTRRMGQDTLETVANHLISFNTRLALNPKSTAADQ